LDDGAAAVCCFKFQIVSPELREDFEMVDTCKVGLASSPVRSDPGYRLKQSGAAVDVAVKKDSVSQSKQNAMGLCGVAASDCSRIRVYIFIESGL
jgi:hypothetical protein